MAILLEIIVFVIVLVVLILVHEFGHFVVAKLSGMRVDEFGIGYPPRALTLGKWGGTEYTLNWLPFGGFVRIYGEDGIDEGDGDVMVTDKDGEVIAPAASATAINTDTTKAAPVIPANAFNAKPRILQALTLIAGIAMNLIFAYILLTITLIIGTPQALSQDQIAKATNVSAAIAAVTPGSPAAKGGIEAGDIVRSVMVRYPLLGYSYSGTSPQGVATLISIDTQDDPIIFTLDRNGKTVYATTTPNEIKEASSTNPNATVNKPVVGITLTSLGTIKTSPALAPVQGLEYTWEVIKETAIGLFNLFKGLLTFSADLSQVSGPIGIAGAVGQATSQGIAAVLSIAALISINLALVNLIPIPALDGGRLLFVIIEAIIERPLDPKWTYRVNTIGFILLIILMLVISGHDIYTLIK